MALTKDEVLASLQGVTDPNGIALPKTKALSDIMVSGDKVYFSITVDSGVVNAWEPVRKRAEEVVKAVPGVASVLAVLTAERQAGAKAAAPAQHGHGHAHGHGQGQGQGQGHGQAGQTPTLPGVGAIIAVASGKGGVGKSTTTANLALGLRDLGLKVGLLDADIYGPSVPKLFNVHGKPQLKNGNTLIPMEGYGIKLMSIGFLVDEETPMIWRGPMVMSALTQMMRDVEWGELDVMLVDMPPGTGDAQLTMAQAVPLRGAVIVSTPQDMALIDARRGVAMFRKVNVPVLGVVENMSYYLCPNCGTRSDIFGHGGARLEAERMGVPFLGEVPLHMDIRERSDAGLPVVATMPDGQHAQIYRNIAAQVRDQVGAGMNRVAPKIVIE
jgi:ATP-binding protein involved in chromosome partitioning